MTVDDLTKPPITYKSSLRLSVIHV